MKIVLIADGRSPITAHWIASVKRLNIRVVLVSSFPCRRPEQADAFHVLPLAFSQYAGSQSGKAHSQPGKNTFKKDLIKRFRSVFMKLRYILGPLTLPWYAIKLSGIVRNARPDLVHALRIPYEGMCAAWLPGDIPLAVSIWGNDLTLHAEGSFLMRWMTRKTLKRANMLAADASRDIRLAKMWGFSEEKPTLVVPGNGGIDYTAIRLAALRGEKDLYWLPANYEIVINPRGFRPGSVRNDTFFQSIPLILSRCPNTLFLCCAMENQPEALDWIQRLQIEKVVVLLPILKQTNLWPLFRRAAVTISVSQHDGTPNSLLEAMTIGCFPVVGDIESMREWITPGVNGMLVDPNDPEQLAAAVVSAIQNKKLRADAAAMNSKMILERVEISSVSCAIGVFYQQLADSRPGAAAAR